MWKNLNEDEAYLRSLNESGITLSSNAGPYVVPIGAIRRDQGLGFPSGKTKDDYDKIATLPTSYPQPSYESKIANVYPKDPYAGDDDYSNFWKRMYGVGPYGH